MSEIAKSKASRKSRKAKNSNKTDHEVTFKSGKKYVNGVEVSQSKKLRFSRTSKKSSRNASRRTSMTSLGSGKTQIMVH